jgi:pimeloyl-ACP methyl ester carboxylesterase
VDLDGPVHYVDHGGSGLPVVLVHGLGGSHVDWLNVAPGLSSHGHVLALDLIGFGRTPPEGRSSSVWSNRDLVQRFVQEVAGAPAVLVGNSMGGCLSILVAAEYPDDVSGLVLVDPAVPPDPDSVDPLVQELFMLYDTPGAGEAVYEQMVTSGDPAAAFQQILPLIFADPTRLRQDMIVAQLEMFAERREQPWQAACFLEAARSLLDLIFHRSFRFEALLPKVQAPTLLIEGEMDRLVQPAAIDLVARARPDWTIEVFPDVGHVPQMEDPDRFDRVVGTWLETLMPPDGHVGAAATDRAPAAPSQEPST